MLLLLVRHADASNSAPSDFERELTDKGRGQSIRVGKFLAARGIVPQVILTSPLVRARQTAELVAAELDGSTVEVEDRLSCGMGPDEAFAMIARCEDDVEVMAMVGHEPDFSYLAATLVGMDRASNIKVKKASCILFEVERAARGGGMLLWHVPCGLLSALAPLA